ncbi:hypothetical protein AALB_0482 [Agarivorans albus MKT 106]|uniref:Uncharacterized protein n=1 Tax=Agarivorans albus MKT 106 TaxID=1331007 RepID=R9PGE3_AGAAL|nr:hypothetical protein AALB_0482 [Agarivorans albus MKT 106]
MSDWQWFKKVPLFKLAALDKPLRKTSIKAKTNDELTKDYLGSCR